MIPLDESVMDYLRIITFGIQICHWSQNTEGDSLEQQFHQQIIMAKVQNKYRHYNYSFTLANYLLLIMGYMVRLNI